MTKKRNAIMVADTRPALIGHLLLQIKDTNSHLFDEAIIYYETISKKDKEIISNIMPCKFIKYKYDFPEKIKELESFNKFSQLMFSRYEMFSLLNQYETITWIDTDVLVIGKLDKIIEKAKKFGIVANFENPKDKSYKYTDTVKTSFKSSFNNNKYNLDLYNMSSGLISVGDVLVERELYTNWCYEQTIKYAEDLILPDQGILNIFIQEFNINVKSAGEKGAYCVYPYYNRDTTKSKIIHAWGARKFWNSWYLYKKFPEWKEYYNKWIKLGGTDIFGKIKPDVSVVIPTYNPKVEYFKYIMKDLLVNQVQDHGFQYDNFEIIIVIDGEVSDEFNDLIKKYDDPRITLIINKERAGISKSINLGIKSAKANYIARIDDDDRVHPDRLYKQYKYLNNNKEINLVTSNFQYFGDMNEERISFEGEMSRAWSIFTCPFNHPTIMFEKSFFINNNLFYDESRKFVEDWELWLRAFEKGLKVANLNEVLYYHRWYAGSAGQNQKTIDMMRELVKNNFLKLNIDLTTEDLKIISPWNGKVSKEQFSKLEEIFLRALENNLSLNLYNQDSLKKAFEYRLFEAENGYVKDIVIQKGKIEPMTVEKKSIKRLLLKPIYSPFKRVFYNIISEAIRDNISEKDILNKKDILDLNSKLTFLNEKTNLILDKNYDYNIEFQILKNNNISNLYFENKIILFGTSEHSNIGDAAITMGEYEFIKKHFPDKKVLEISTYEFFDKLNYISKVINNEDILLLQGGGNLGDKFISEEKVRRYVIENFPNNKIIILPQTIYFSDNAKGLKELEISREIYNKHQNLTIFTRGKISLKFAEENFYNSNHYTMIDSALNLNYNFNYNRNGIVACIRDINDESGFAKDVYNNVINIINNYDKNYYFTNNLHDFDISKMDRNKTVLDQLKLFSKHKLVVTDRLHGLIFSLMTNTPCIVMSSYNYKLKEFTDMLKGNKFVKFIDKNVDILDVEIKNMLEIDISNYKNDFSKEFAKMADIIKKDKDV